MNITDRAGFQIQLSIFDLELCLFSIMGSLNSLLATLPQCQMFQLDPERQSISSSSCPAPLSIAFSPSSIRISRQSVQPPNSPFRLSFKFTLIKHPVEGHGLKGSILCRKAKVRSATFLSSTHEFNLSSLRILSILFYDDQKFCYPI